MSPSACIFVTLDPNRLRRPVQKAPRPVGRSGGRLRSHFDDLEIGGQMLALGLGPSSTAMMTMTRKKIVLIIIGMAKPMFICTAK